MSRQILGYVSGAQIKRAAAKIAAAAESAAWEAMLKAPKRKESYGWMTKRLESLRPSFYDNKFRARHRSKAAAALYKKIDEEAAFKSRLSRLRRRMASSKIGRAVRRRVSKYKSRFRWRSEFSKALADIAPPMQEGAGGAALVEGDSVDMPPSGNASAVEQQYAAAVAHEDSLAVIAGALGLAQDSEAMDSAKRLKLARSLEAKRNIEKTHLRFEDSA